MRERAGLEYKYDLIYIDPPYNTETSKDDGNSIADDKENIKANKFIYRDKYSRNGWLNLMNERLRLARQLLKDDGVIFVSIDDAEQAYLKVLMDEIFGEENFVSCIVNKKGRGKSDSKFLSNKKEYILVYAININNLEFRKQSSPIENYKYEDNKAQIFFKRIWQARIRLYKITWLPYRSPWWNIYLSRKKLWKVYRKK
ncbi:site-specific DNA-methyltransferase [Mycoplasmopsis felis]|uniref:DNA methyltransferase n=1 Tax=Mycoplasmopsis felis TaxID=33923 RepID=UPI0021DF4477|nr:site-specific DNA-methyltransferase [Mycoplasmopsis felis]MCU9934393.1 site-specific DNA-methyltransferase [Mycoplasmopsis felis]